MSFPRIVIALAIFAAGCSPQPRIRTQATPGTDFSKYRTYAIRPGNVVYPGASEAQRAEIEKRVQDSIARELEARGLTPQPDEPELVVTYTAGAQQRQPGVSGAPGRAPEGVDISGPSGYDEPGQVHARESPDAAGDMEFRRGYTEGNLVIDLLDAKTRRLIWRATVNLEVASDRGGKLIDPIVAKAFADVPLGNRVSKPATQP